MVPCRVAGGTAQSSSSSGIFFQGDGQSQVAGNSQFSSDFGNSLNSLLGHTRGNIGPVSGDTSNTILNSMASSGPSVGASSLVTDANSGLSGGPHLQRSASINTESYMRLPSSPMSFSSNNISISGSSAMDVSSVVQQSSANQNLGSHHAQQSQQYQGASSATSLPRMGHVQMPGRPRIPNSCSQDPITLSQLHKKPRLDIKQDDVLQQQVQQLLLQRQDSMHMHNQNPQLQAMIQQQRLREQHLLQAMPSMQRVQLLQQQHQQMQLRQQQLQMQAMPPAAAIKRPYDGSVCSRQLMQYLYHQRQRPAENAIFYWKKFVKEYYSENAKKRWCLSRYNNVGHQSLGVFPQSAMDAWHCDICGSKSGRGFEATFEVLPRLYEIKVGSGVIDELLFLDLPRECRFPSGMLMLEYAKAVEESVYEQLRVVREGQLRILFTPDLKILSWEFCARRHEELLPRRLVAPQVNQILQLAHKCQTTISKSGTDGASQSDLQANSAIVVTAGRQLAKSLELHSLNDLGFSKRYVRCLQIADVVNSMKDLMDFCREHKKGPIEGLRSFPQRTMPPRVQLQRMQEMERIEGLEGVPTDYNTLNKLMALQHSGLNGQMNSNQHLGGRGALIGSAQAALALTSFQNLMRQNSMNSMKKEGSSPSNNPSPTLSTTTPEPAGALPGTLQNSAIGGLPNCQAPQQHQLQLHSSGLLHQRMSLPSQGSQALQHQMIQQLLQEMNKKSNSEPLSQHPLHIQNPSSAGISFRNSPAATSSGTGSGIANGPPSNRSNNFKAAASSSNNGSPTLVGFSQKEPDIPPSLHSMDEMVPDMPHEFIDGFFSNELDDNMNFSWKA